MVGPSNRYFGIGIDLEPDVPMDGDLVGEICKPEDLVGVADAEQPLLPKRIFSAKEAVYKAHFALAGVPFGFQALSLDLVTKRAVFTDHPEVQVIPAAVRQDLFFEQWICDGMILSLCTIPK
jgi:4'-phosphopantetheinyl transferase EntD